MKARLIIASVLIAVGVGGFIYFYTASKKPETTTPTLSQSTKPSVDGTKKTEAEKTAYSVAPDRPRQLIIPSISVDANIHPVDRLTDGSLGAPMSAWDVGWYNASSLPGLGYGALLMDGHVNDSLNMPGVFAELGKLQQGDTIMLERGDGEKFSYRVVRVEQKPAGQVDMAAMLRSVAAGKEGLNLITCSGIYDDKRQTYSDRTLVFSERI